ncbi:MAG: chemotaxis protein CheX [bacterium]
MNSCEVSLASTATRTLEDMCFFAVSPLLSDLQRDARTDGAMEVLFHGPKSGRLVIRLAGGALTTLASNMLGDVYGSPDMQLDALGEVANVICGNLLPVICGTREVYHISVARSAVMLEWNEPGLKAAVRLGLQDAGRADLQLYMHPTAGIA